MAVVVALAVCSGAVSGCAAGQTPADADAAVAWARGVVVDVAAVLGEAEPELEEMDLSASDSLGADDPSRMSRMVAVEVPVAGEVDFAAIGAIAREAGLERNGGGEDSAFYHAGDRLLNVAVTHTDADGTPVVRVDAETEPFPFEMIEGR